MSKSKSPVDKFMGRDFSYGVNRAARALEKELKLYTCHTAGKKEWLKNRQDFDTERIQVGGGAHYLKNFLNIDLLPPADLICDVREGLPLDNECAKYIFSEHFLEHLDYPISAKNFISECFRVLKRGGELVIGVPDSGLIIKNYSDNNMIFYNEMLMNWYKNRNCLSHFNTYIDLVNYHFRDQDDDAKYNPHYWGYDLEKLQSLMSESGFKDIKRWDFDETIANSKREWGSIYVIAKKD